MRRFASQGTNAPKYRRRLRRRRSLYVAESAEQLAVLRTNGTLEEYPTDGLTIDGFARSHECAIWFVGHDPFGKATVGTIALVRR